MGDTILAFLNANPEFLVALLTTAIMGISGWLMGLLPQGEPGGIWDFVRKIVNRVVGNVKNARNVDTNGA